MTDKEGRTPLHFACGVGQVAIVKMLVEAGAALEAVDAMANTPLHYAAGYGRAPVVAALLEAGASGKAKNQNGKTPADLVTMEPRNPLNGDAEMVKRLAAAAAA